MAEIRSVSLLLLSGLATVQVGCDTTVESPNHSAVVEKRVALAIRLAPFRLREDAEQEACLARLSGQCPLSAVNRFLCREKRRAKREICMTDLFRREPDA